MFNSNMSMVVLQRTSQCLIHHVIQSGSIRRVQLVIRPSSSTIVIAIVGAVFRHTVATTNAATAADTVVATRSRCSLATTTSPRPQSRDFGQVLTTFRFGWCRGTGTSVGWRMWDGWRRWTRRPRHRNDWR